jgi:hypothetical protein
MHSGSMIESQTFDGRCVCDCANANMSSERETHATITSHSLERSTDHGTATGSAVGPTNLHRDPSGSFALRARGAENPSRRGAGA